MVVLVPHVSLHDELVLFHGQLGEALFELCDLCAVRLDPVLEVLGDLVVLPVQDGLQLVRLRLLLLEPLKPILNGLQTVLLELYVRVQLLLLAEREVLHRLLPVQLEVHVPDELLVHLVLLVPLLERLQQAGRPRDLVHQVRDAVYLLHDLVLLLLLHLLDLLLTLALPRLVVVQLHLAPLQLQLLRLQLLLPLLQQQILLAVVVLHMLQILRDTHEFCLCLL